MLFDAVTATCVVTLFSTRLVCLVSSFYLELLVYLVYSINGTRRCEKNK